MKLREIRRRHTVIIDGQAEHVYLIVSGFVKVTTETSQPERLFIGLIGPGELFGLAAFLPEANHRYRCDAFSDCSVAEFPAEKFAQLALGIPIDNLRSIMSMTMGRWWWGIPLWSMRTTRMSLEDRLGALLVELSRKFGLRDSRGMIINARLTHADLAALLGCARTKLTTVINHLEATGMVMRTEGRFIVADTLRACVDSLAVDMSQKEVER